LPLKEMKPEKILKCKARFVAQGFRQIDGLDYHEAFSPVIHKKSLRLLLTIAVENDW
jgi:hypothetical protein